jgi:deoxyribodipyrimidine photolyase-related protein
LLAGLKPEEVHHWYLGIYIDAFEWVELPNTLGMSQYADGGQLASKPYVSSASYINKMSNYCKSCHYDFKKRVGDNACPFNSLYWNFFATHQDKLAKNQRLGIVYNQLKKMDTKQKQQLMEQSQIFLKNINAI